MSDKSVLCLPGFLGTASDFDWVSENYEIKYVDLFNSDEYKLDFFKFSEKLKNHCINNKIDTVLGYSLGGRLILNTICIYPDLFKKVVIISSHTGLETKEEKSTRVLTDLNWANKFKSNFNDAFIEWNSQSIFQNNKLIRSSKNYNVKNIEYALTTWSLGNQENLINKLSSINSEVLWVVGEKDSKFINIANNAKNVIKNCSIHIISGSGHRVMHENPAKLVELIKQFIG
jgi:2-succinyl-6-hydroxy-2,4-cyclohexadiene-1-carboxylate synthase